MKLCKEARLISSISHCAYQGRMLGCSLNLKQWFPAYGPQPLTNDPFTGFAWTSRTIRTCSYIYIMIHYSNKITVLK